MGYEEMKLNKLKSFAMAKGYVIEYIDFKAYWGVLIDNYMLLRKNMNKEKELYTIAHELAHGYLHRDKGNTIESPKHEEYEEEANRTAELILDLLSMDMNSCNIGGNL